MSSGKSIVALLPFLVRGALSLIVLREMRRRGFDVTIAYYMPKAGGYTIDSCEEFQADGRLLNLVDTPPAKAVELISKICNSKSTCLLLQVGAPQAYRQLPYVRERCADICICDILYNPIGHTLNHFLYESVFDAAIVESSAMQAFVMQNTSLSGKVTHVVESGVDLTEFFPATLDPSDRRPFVLGYVGRMSPEKNPLGFIELAEKLSQSIPDLNFKLFGEGPQSSDVIDALKLSKASDVIELHGYAPHVRDAMHTIDCLVVPSKVDGRPNIIMEANACGVPVIAAPVGGIPELIREGVNGYLRTPSDFVGINLVVSKLIANQHLMASIRKSSRAAAVARFDRNGMFDRYAHLFAGIA